MPKDLRNFLEWYEETHPEDLIHIEKEVGTNQEIMAIVARLEKMGKFPVLFFDRVRSVGNESTAFRIVTNVLASRSRLARVCNSTFETLGRDVYQAARDRRERPLVIRREEAPVKEVVQTGDRINLFQFPIQTHNAMDAGPYLSAGFLTTYDPDTGTDNCALQRGWVKERDTVRIMIFPRMHNGINLSKYEKQNRDMPAAYWLGHHPVAYVGGLAKLGYPGSHWGAIGGMLGEPLRLVPSESLGANFLVPADAEVVIEGFIEANKRYAEGPFGEFTRHVGPQIPCPQFRVTAVSYRRDAIWYNVAAGWTDHQGTGGAAIEGRLWEALKARFPSLCNVYMPLSGTGRLHVYLQFKDPGPAEARQAIIMATTLMAGLIKHVFAFDDDVDIFDEREVMWAIATRSQWDRDVIILPRTSEGALDPSAGLPGESATGGIDCTKPWNQPFAERVRVAPDVRERVRLDDYIRPEILDRVREDRRGED